MEWDENKQVQRSRSWNATREDEREVTELGRRQKHKTIRNWIGRWKRKKEETTREKERIMKQEKKDSESGIRRNSGGKLRQIAKEERIKKEIKI
jgi:hypothetical protein